MNGWKGYLSFTFLLVNSLGLLFLNEFNCSSEISCGKIMHIVPKDNKYVLEGDKSYD